MITKVKLLEKEYEIYNIHNFENNPLQVGEIIEHQDTISLSGNQSNSNRHIVLFHELVHALFQQTGHSEYDNDENLIDCIALGIYSLVKNNDFSFMRNQGETKEYSNDND